MNKVKIFFIGIVVVFILLVFFVVSLLNHPRTSAPSTAAITPTTVQFNQKGLFITSIMPTDTTATYSPAQPIEITFTQPVKKESLRYTIVPFVEVLIGPGSSENTLIISPLTMWTVGETTISILSQTMSSSGSPLQNPRDYILKTAIPTIPEHLDGAY